MMNKLMNKENLLLLGLPLLVFSACKSPEKADEQDAFKGAISKPLVTKIYTADPSAHVFGGKIYIYPSHDVESNMKENDNGDHFDMRDYHIFSMDSIGGAVTDHGVALSVKDIPWAGRQLWAPDAAFKAGTYFLYFPVKDKKDIFRIGVATSTSPTGPFVPEKTPIEGSYSIDPAVFEDSDGSFYMYFGGIWGGQLQQWNKGIHLADGSKTDLKDDKAPALTAKIAKLSPDMRHFAEEVKDVVILDQEGKPLLGGDHDRRFFEGAWMHKFKDKYYFSYSTGNTHLLVYATADNPYGPFTYQGVLMKPVVGWTTHHSIVESGGKWWLFYHDTEVSGGKTYLRNVKVTELKHDAEGKLVEIDPYGKSN